MGKHIPKFVMDKLKKSYGQNDTYTKVCDEIVLEIQKDFIKSFPVYVAKYESIDKNGKRTGKCYMTAWTKFPHSINNLTRTFKVSVGRYVDFNGTTDKRCKILGRNKILKRLQKEYGYLF